MTNNEQMEREAKKAAAKIEGVVTTATFPFQAVNDKGRQKVRDGFTIVILQAITACQVDVKELVEVLKDSVPSPAVCAKYADLKTKYGF